MDADPSVTASLVEEILGPLLTITEDGIVLSWNQAAERVFGYTSEEAVGKAFVSLLVPDDLVDESRRWLKLALARGSATYDSVKKTKKGELLNVEVTDRVVDDRASPRVIAINIRDITPFKYLRQTKVLESRFRGLLEAAPDAMIIIDPQGQIVLAN
jgi:PAS domain S-box-containing protein